MKTFVSKFYFSLLCLSVATATFSQNYLKSYQTVENELKSDLDYLFQYLDKSKITSGLLSNYALELTELAPYNGVLSDTNQVNRAVWLNLYRSIYSAKINGQVTLATPETVEAKVKNSPPVNDAVPLALLHYEYDCFDENAVNNGWLTYSGGRLHDVTGQPSPYLKKHLFAVAPQEQIFKNGTVAFVFQSDLFYRNNSKTVSGLYIDFDNSGWQSASWNTAVSHTFTSGGNKSVRFKVHYSDGSDYFSHTHIYVQATPPPFRAANGSPYTNKRDTIAATYSHSGGIMEMHLHNPALGLRKPLIIAEPFDMSATLTVATPYNLDYIISQVPAIQSLIEELEYDVVYVNYNNGLDDIFRNAELFKAAIRRVNDKKDKTVNMPNVVIGVSMGGLVARYALSTMESQGEEHDTWKYISLDAPHKGANLPLGLQAMVRHIESLLQEYGGGSNGDVLNQLFGVLNATATKQMLVYHCASGGNVDNSVHDAFQERYDAIGFPKRCRNIAVSNGAVQGNPIFDPYTEIFNYQPDMGELMTLADVNIWQQLLIALGLAFVDIITLGEHSFNSEFSVHALPNKKVSTIYNGYTYYRKYFLFGLFRKTFHLTQRSLNSEAYMLPLDGAAGSFNEFKLGNSTNDARVDSLLKNFLKNEFTFIPTGSALALSNWDKLLNTNISNRDLYAEGLTDFDEIRVTADNKKHPNFTHAASFLAQHLAEPPVSFNLASAGFNTSTTIPLKNPQNVAVTWSVSNNDFSLCNTSNTSATLVCDRSNQTGIVTASATVSDPKFPALLGVSSLAMQVRKRMQSLSTMSIEGNFERASSTATVQIPDLQAGIPVSWSLSDTSNFRIVSSAANSAVIEALSYGKTTTVTATLQLQGKQVSDWKYLTSPSFSFYFPNLDCQEKKISVSPILAEYDSIEWDFPPASKKYLEITSATNQPTITVKGLQNIDYRTPLWVNVKVKVKGEIFTDYHAASVMIPEELKLSIVDSEDRDKKIWLRAITNPDNSTKNGSYIWRTNKGTITPCVSKTIDHLLVSSADFTAIAQSDTVSSTDLSSNLLRSIVAEATGDENIDIENNNITLTRSAVVAQDNKTKSVVLNVSVENSLLNNYEQLNLDNSSQAATTVADNPTPLSNHILLHELDDIYLATDGLWALIPAGIPDNDPSYAMLEYEEGTTIVTCDFVSPCNETLRASVSMFISGDKFSCTYTSGSHSITITTDNQDEDNNEDNSASNSENSNNNGGNYTGNSNYFWHYDPDTGVQYKVYIYNDYGLVKEVPFDASTKTISIPMHGYPNGFYYVNVVDSQGNVVKRQTVLVQ